MTHRAAQRPRSRPRGPENRGACPCPSRDLSILWPDAACAGRSRGMRCAARPASPASASQPRRAGRRESRSRGSATDGMIVPPPGDPGGYDLALDPEPVPASAAVPGSSSVAAPRSAGARPGHRPGRLASECPFAGSRRGRRKRRPPSAARPVGLWPRRRVGCAAAILAVLVAIRAVIGGGPLPASYPDPSADIALGVASKAGSPATPTAAPPAPAVAAVSNPAPAPSAGNPPPAAVVADRAPSPATTPAPPLTPRRRPRRAAADRGAGAPLTTAQIVARWEPSVALVKGQGRAGPDSWSGPGIVATNAHVIDDEFISALEVRFPSAPEGQQGPLAGRAALRGPEARPGLPGVATALPAIEVAPSYAFLKGEDITVIGNPGLGEEIVLENAISRGVMSSKAVIEGLNYLQINIAINPGNSGGPVFDSAGRVDRRGDAEVDQGRGDGVLHPGRGRAVGDGPARDAAPRDTPRGTGRRRPSRCSRSPAPSTGSASTSARS